MRILLTNNHLVWPGGTETWTRAMAHHLIAQGHAVDVLTLQRGAFAETFRCPVLTAPVGSYDVGLVNHNTCLPLARAACSTVVFTSHGIYSDLEQPVEGADLYVAISEEVATHLEAKGFNPRIVRNAVDPAEFPLGPPTSPVLTRVLSLCQGAGAAYQVGVACTRLGIEFRVKGIQSARVDDTRGDIQWADCVVGLGRTALEAMASGRAVLVLDSRPYMQPAMDGMLTIENAETFMSCNFSGRAIGVVPTVDAIIDELERYSADMGRDNHDLVRQRFTTEVAWRQYEGLVESATGSVI